MSSAKEPQEMRLKSYIPRITVPLAVILLLMFIAEAGGGGVDLGRDGFRHAVKLALCALWLSTGLTKWNRPYIVADDVGLTVFGHWFSMKPSAALLWLEIAGAAGRSFWDFRVRLTDGTTVRIPLNGMRGADVDALLAFIDAHAGRPPGGGGAAPQGS